jgi:hypothetical protein
VADITVPDQIAEPDWEEVKYFAEKAAAATMEGNMVQANDFYQHVANTAMEALYGPSAVAKFIKYAMDNEPPKEEKRIILR